MGLSFRGERELIFEILTGVFDLGLRGGEKLSLGLQLANSTIEMRLWPSTLARPMIDARLIGICPSEQ